MFHSRRNIPLLLAQTFLLVLAACSPSTAPEGAPVSAKPECNSTDAKEVKAELKMFNPTGSVLGIRGLMLVSWGSVMTPTLPTLDMLPLEGTPVVQSLFDIDPEEVHMYGAASIPLSEGHVYGVPIGIYFIPQNQIEVTLTLWEEDGIPLSRKTQEATTHMVCLEPVEPSELDEYPSGYRGWMK